MLSDPESLSGGRRLLGLFVTALPRPVDEMRICLHSETAFAGRSLISYLRALSVVRQWCRTLQWDRKFLSLRRLGDSGCNPEACSHIGSDPS